MPTIHVKIALQYGNRRIFPADEQSLLFARIAGCRTLTDDAIDAIKKLGFTVEVVTDEPKTL